jgi:hypothetical protein
MNGLVTDQGLKSSGIVSVNGICPHDDHTGLAGGRGDDRTIDFDAPCGVGCPSRAATLLVVFTGLAAQASDDTFRCRLRPTERLLAHRKRTLLQGLRPFDPRSFASTNM